MKRNNILLLTIVLALSIRASGQKPSETESFSKLYSEYNAVWLKKKIDATVCVENGKLKIVNNVTEELLIIYNPKSSSTVVTIPFSVFTEISDIEAYTLVPKSGNSYRKVKSGTPEIQSSFGSSSFFDDGKQYAIPFYDFTENSRRVLKYKETYREPRFFDSFFLCDFRPVHELEIKVTVPKGTNLKYKVFNADTMRLVSEVNNKGETTEYFWKATLVRAYSHTNDAPSVTWYVPHIVLYIASYPVDGVSKKFIDGLPSLYEWYYPYWNQGYQHEPDSMKAMLKHIIAGETDTNIIRINIFHWVQDNIKYIAFEDGLGGYIPSKPTLTFQRRYGDCKDMATLLVALYRAAGLSAYPVWIGSRRIPYKITEVPSPASFNHMIAVLPSDTGWIFLDATHKNLNFGMPSYGIQGKQAFIAIDPQHYQVAEVPVVLPDANVSTDTLVADISGNDISGTGSAEYKGYFSSDIQYLTQGLSATNKLNFFRNLLSKGNNKFFLDNVFYSDNAFHDESFNLTYSFRIGSYLSAFNDELFVNPHLVDLFQKEAIDTARRDFPLDFDYMNIKDHDIRINIPEGYHVSFLPENKQFHEPGFGYDLQYSLSDNYVTIHLSSYIKTLLLEPETFGSWNAMMKQIARNYKETISLKKTEP
ncbi:MAG: transglutaminase family protein [Bacteroidetes bacterium]|nr:transglutaminase family protein [Bacteroidota bacterium]MBU1717929.1 transglutaminase family protein [Bacteroidota bacterium]